MGVAGGIIEHDRANYVLDGFDRAPPLALAEVRHVLLEGDDQFLGVHRCSNTVAVRDIIPL